MPIYAYKCESCAHAKDVLQKISDPLLTVCPACGQSTFKKQLTSAGFQLKGSGWYVTDFKGDSKSGGKPAESGSSGGEGGEGKSDTSPAAAAPASISSEASAAPAVAAAPATPAAAKPAAPGSGA